MRRIAFGITGASGMIYATALLRRLMEAGARVDLCISDPARGILRDEVGIELDPCTPDTCAALWPGPLKNLKVHGLMDLAAPPATGSSDIEAVVICPCSMGTLGRIAAGVSDNLIARMADVALKEKRRLILVPRETPLSIIHLRAMLTLAEAGAVILPACPGFYDGPASIEDLVAFVVGRVLRHLELSPPEV